jgi:hypothetical protein
MHQWVEERLESEREFVLGVVGQALSKLLDEQHEAAKSALQDEVRELRLELTQLELALTELRSVLAKERGLAATHQPMRTVN